MTQPNQSELKCGHTAPDWNGEGDCITCARDKVLRVDNTSAEELQATCHEIQVLTRLTDDEWRKLFFNEGGLYGFITSYTKQRELALLERLEGQKGLLYKTSDSKMTIRLDDYVPLSAIQIEKEKLV